MTQINTEARDVLAVGTVTFLLSWLQVWRFINRHFCQTAMKVFTRMNPCFDLLRYEWYD